MSDEHHAEITIDPYPSIIQFMDRENNEVGRLEFADDGALTFEGNADESAKIFFEHVIQRSTKALAEAQELRSFVAASAGLECPNRECDNKGWYAQQISDDEAEQVQCEFCYAVDDSIFNRRRKRFEEVVKDG